MSTRVCFGNWYHHDFYCAYNLIWFQRDHHICPAFCSCFTNFLQMMSKWSSLLLDSGSSTPFLPCGYKAIHQTLFWDLPEIIHLSQFLILFFYGQEKPKKKPLSCKDIWCVVLNMHRAISSHKKCSVSGVWSHWATHTTPAISSCSD